MIGLMDCNNFFVSCERVFNPKIQGKAVVVLSNNDGCAVSRSNEAKAIGIKMGEPFFKIKHLVDEGKLFVCSSNYTLYGNMSSRIMSIAASLVPNIEVYSIDECFLDFDGIEDARSLGLKLSARVKKWTGVPVSIGIAPTKTLAKMASKFAKKYPGYEACCLIDSDEKREKALRLFDIGDVWGIGRKNLQKLQYHGVKTAFDFANWEEKKVRRLFSLPGVQTWRELNGERCVEMEKAKSKQSLTTSRSFATTIKDFNQLRELVANFASICSAKLRKQKGRAANLAVFIRTDFFRTDAPQYSEIATYQFDVPTSDPRELVEAAERVLKVIYREGYAYKKAGVMIGSIVQGALQTTLFDNVDRFRQEKLLEALDKINQKNGSSAVRVAAEGNVLGAMNRNFSSSCFTTNIDDVIKVKI